LIGSFLPFSTVLTQSDTSLPSIAAVRKVYSITLSAQPSTDNGIVSPWAVLKLIGD
jgi:hypothetical protein